MAQSNDKLLAEHVRDHVYLLKRSPEINYLFSRLQTTSNRGVAIFGGAVRDWWLGYDPKDIDIVIDTDYFKEALEGIQSADPLFNAFDGRTFTLSNVKFDVWNLRDTQAFKSKQFEPSWENLLKSVPFNLDSVLVMLTGGVHEYRFWSALATQRIEFVNKIHSDPKFIAQRARAFATKYGVKLDRELEEFTIKQLGNDVSPIAEIDGDKLPLRSSNRPFGNLGLDEFPF